MSKFRAACHGTIDRRAPLTCLGRINAVEPYVPTIGLDRFPVDTRTLVAAAAVVSRHPSPLARTPPCRGIPPTIQPERAPRPPAAAGTTGRRHFLSVEYPPVPRVPASPRGTARQARPGGNPPFSPGRAAPPPIRPLVTTAQRSSIGVPPPRAQGPTGNNLGADGGARRWQGQRPSEPSPLRCSMAGLAAFRARAKGASFT